MDPEDQLQMNEPQIKTEPMEEFAAKYSSPGAHLTLVSSHAASTTSSDVENVWPAKLETFGDVPMIPTTVGVLEDIILPPTQSFTASATPDKTSTSIPPEDISSNQFLPFTSDKSLTTESASLAETAYCIPKTTEREFQGELTNCVFVTKSSTRHGQNASLPVLSGLLTSVKDELSTLESSSTMPVLPQALFPNYHMAGSPETSRQYQICQQAYSECSICITGFLNEDSMKEHMSNVHQNSVIDNIKQEHTNHEERDLVAELERIPPDKIVMMKYDKSGNLRPLLNTKRFTCDICKKEYRVHAAFEKHKLTHQTFTLNRTCSICKKVFPSKRKLDAHRKDHKGDNFPCMYCDKTFMLMSDRAKHMKFHTRRRTFKCDYCEKAYFSNSDLNLHRKLHTGERPFKCEFCGKGFIQRHHLKEHILNHTGEKNFECSVCHKRFGLLKSMKRHEENVHTETERREKKVEKKFYCHICKKTYSDLKALARHINEHRFPCEVCPMSFPNTKKLAMHRNSHIRNELYCPCLRCGKMCRGEEALRLHSKTHGNLKCPVCHVGPLNLAALQKHIGQQHKTALNVSCSVCKKLVFKDKYIWDLNDKTGTNLVSVIECGICKERFLTTLSLALHMKVHQCEDVEEFYKCHICQELFKEQKELRIHIWQSHEEEQKDACDICKISLSVGLTEEAVDNDKEKVCSCDLCDKQFMNINFLQKHILTHIYDKQETKCSMCSVKFENVSSLKTHIASFHKQTPDFPQHKEIVDSPIFECHICSVEVKDIAMYYKHLQQHKSVLNYSCSICRKLVYMEKFVKDSKRGNIASVIECGVCQERFKAVSYLAVHMRNHFLLGLKHPDVCHICQEKLQTPQDLRIHVWKLHEREQKRACDICRIALSRGLKENNDVTQKEALCPCELCHKKFKNTFYLKKHILTHIAEAKGPRYSCGVCDKVFTTINAVQAHISKGHKIISKLEYKEFESVDVIIKHRCQICRVDETNMISLREHTQRVHKKSLNYGCSICKELVFRKEKSQTGQDETNVVKCGVCKETRTFKTSQELGMHMLIHQHKGRKKVLNGCNRCLDGFENSKELKIHIWQTHTEDQKYACDICKIALSVGLKEEENVESVKECKCQLCDKIFKSSNILKEHILTHIEDKVPIYKCGTCFANFASPAGVKAHIIHKHRPKPATDTLKKTAPPAIVLTKMESLSKMESLLKKEANKTSNPD